MSVQVGHVGDDGELFRGGKGGRQHHVGKLGHFRGVGDHMHKERHLRQRFVPALGSGGREIEVAPGTDEHLDRVGMFEHAVGDIISDNTGLGAFDNLAVLVFLGINAPHDGRHILGTAAIELFPLARFPGEFVHEHILDLGEFISRGAGALKNPALGFDGSENTV